MATGKTFKLLERTASTFLRVSRQFYSNKVQQLRQIGDGRFKIAVDQEIVNDHITSPIVALSYTFSLFYFLNIKYPKEMALSLEFIQRVFLGINPERGSKAEMKGSKHQHIPPRLMRFLYELNNFENPWKISFFFPSSIWNLNSAVIPSYWQWHMERGNDHTQIHGALLPT